MDTKWKSKKVIIITILLLSFGLSIFASAVTNGRDILTGNYFQSNDFQYNTFYEYQELLRVFVLSDWTEEDFKNQIIVTDDEVEEHRYRYGDLTEQITSIKDQYETRINDLNNAGNTEAAEVLEKEQNEKIQDITLNFSSDEHVRAKVRQEKVKEIESALNELESNKSTWNLYKNVFDYYLVDEETKDVFTSLNKEEAANYKAYFAENKMRYVESYTENQMLSINLNISHSEYVHISYEFGGEPDYHDFTGYIGIPKSVPATNSFVEPIEQFEKFQIFYVGLVITGTIALLVGGIFLYLIKPFTKRNHLQSKLFNKMPFDLRTVVLVLISGLCFIALNIMIDVSYWGFGNSVYRTIYSTGASIIGFSIFFIVSFLYLSSIKGRSFEELLRGTVIFKLIQAIKDAFVVRNVGFQLTALLGLIVILPFILLFALYTNSGVFLFFVSFIAVMAAVFILYIIFKYTGYFNAIVKTINELADGKFVEEINIPGKTIFAQVADDINMIKDGVKISQREQVKSERLKTELITNVSHDLRTPLTSIITYTDLLKSDDLTEEDRHNYVEIIDRKSKRLKVLIDDLFEASKMATGNIDLNKSQVELVQLLQQALAEYDEKIEQSQLHFRVTHDDQPIEATVDGQKLWRVFDNLINNILKYSLPNTRVYISVKNHPDTVEIIFKNVSHYELGDNVDELFERFKRGDKSRHTDGSGLGLAIAKSIIDLHEGEMSIEVDGDLFKVTITLNK